MAGKTQNKQVLLELACPPAWKTAGDVTEWDVVLHAHESINEDFSWHQNFYLPSPSWTLWLTEIRDQLPPPSTDYTTLAFSSSPLVPLPTRGHC